MRALAILSVLLALAALALSGWLWQEHLRLEERLLTLERAHREASPTPPAPPAPDVASLAEAVAPLVAQRAPAPAPGALPEASMRRLTEGLADLEQLSVRVDSIEARTKTAEEATRALTTQAAADRADRQPRVEHPDEPAKKKHKHDKQVLSDLAASLQLDSGQEAAVREALEASKKKAYELLLTPRQDGGNFMDELADLFITKGDAAEGDAQQLFMRAFKEPLPGTNETFGSQILALQADARAEMRKQLRPEQTESFDAMDIDFFDIETASDPLRDHIIKRAAAQTPAPR